MRAASLAAVAVKPARSAATTASLWSPPAPAPRRGADTLRTAGSLAVNAPIARPIASIAPGVDEFAWTDAAKATYWAMSSAPSKGMISTLSFPASILEKSRMSLMSESSAWPELRIVSANSCCSEFRSVSQSRCVKPMMPFIGVRISWLIVARNSLLA